ncbi:PR domain zinc finger protein 13-like, partial [Oxyura jamaicensis]|uniref:PR domain zinc finger protein 13-like n=1 Tax=Oxyura jamaicensis TaxID=8884 RepID=UPI0015A5A259
MQTSRAPAISVSAESCIPAGLRLGPVPGIFKLGKYLSDRREPGPKKKVRMVRGELVDEAGSSALEWIGLIRAARNAQEQTLEAISDLPGGQIFYRALRDVQPGEELTVWYSNPLAQWFDIPVTATPTHDEKADGRSQPGVSPGHLPASQREGSGIGVAAQPLSAAFSLPGPSPPQAPLPAGCLHGSHSTEQRGTAAPGGGDTGDKTPGVIPGCPRLSPGPPAGRARALLNPSALAQGPHEALG